MIPVKHLKKTEYVIQLSDNYEWIEENIFN